MRRVVVTGLGAVTPVGLNVEESWGQALEGRSGIDSIHCFDAENLPVRIAGEVGEFDGSKALDAREQKRLSRFIQLAVVASHEAVHQAGIADIADKQRFGCCIGVGIGAIQEIDRTAVLIKEKGPKWVSPFFIPYVITNMAAGVVSQKYGLAGPSLCTTTACTSGTHAIGEGWLHIRSGLADVMVCGGSEAALSTITVAGFANMKALSRRNDQPQQSSRPFDVDRDGFVLAEGAGIVVLEEYEHARKRGATILAEMSGYGMSGDAHHITSPEPQGDGARRCMHAALTQAKISPDKVSYVNAHGTSTQVGDICETLAIKSVFGEHAKKLAVSSTKGVTGHCLGAAGGVEAVFLVKSIEQQAAPPTANLENPDPECDLDYVPKAGRNMPIEVGISNSFGFGGTNGTLVMSKI